jgi:hypothetical protein
MNAFNRVFVVAALIALIIAGTITLVSPALTLSLIRNAADSMRAGPFAGFTDVGRVITRFILAIVWIALIGALLWLELRRPGSRTVEIARYTGGNTIRISTDAVAEKIKEEVCAVAGVIDAKVRAIGRNRAVELQLDVSAAKDVDLVAKAEEIATLTRRIAQDELGLKLTGKPQVAIKAKQGKPAQIKQTSKPAFSSIEEPAALPTMVLPEPPIIIDKEPQQPAQP